MEIKCQNQLYPDSDLDAFSHNNPTHHSFVPLTFQPSVMTNYVSQENKVETKNCEDGCR